MPFPFLPLLILTGAGILTALGIKKGVEAKEKLSEASEKTEKAQQIYDEAKYPLQSVRNNTQKELEQLGRQKLDLYKDGLVPFVASFSQIKDKIDFTDPDLTVDKNVIFTETDLADIQKITLKMSSILAGGATALGGGALAGIGAFGGAGLLATASTGTAIWTLSGAAATNATLAWFGGGALAAGGAGMAGGTVVLGGIVAAPVLAVGGFILDKMSEAALQDAYTNLTKAKAAAEVMETARIAAKAILQRTVEINGVIKQLADPFQNTVEELRNLVQKSAEYHQYTEREKNIVRNSAAFAVTTKNILEVPIIEENGTVTEKSRQLLQNVRNFLAELAKK